MPITVVFNDLREALKSIFNPVTNLNATDRAHTAEK